MLASWLRSVALSPPLGFLGSWYMSEMPRNPILSFWGGDGNLPLQDPVSEGWVFSTFFEI